LRIELVNRLAMFGNVQSQKECRNAKGESNLFRRQNRIDKIIQNVKPMKTYAGLD
jgi:hypothetical protein